MGSEEDSPCKRKCRSWSFEEEDSRSSRKEDENRTLELFPLHPESRWMMMTVVIVYLFSFLSLSSFVAGKKKDTKLSPCTLMPYLFLTWEPNLLLSLLFLWSSAGEMSCFGWVIHPCWLWDEHNKLVESNVVILGQWRHAPTSSLAIDYCLGSFESGWDSNFFYQNWKRSLDGSHQQK